MNWHVWALAEDRGGAQIGAVLLLLVSETNDRVAVGNGKFENRENKSWEIKDNFSMAAIDNLLFHGSHVKMYASFRSKIGRCKTPGWSV